MASYRDDLEAAQARADALDREVADLREKNEALEKRAQTAETAAKTPAAKPRQRIVPQLEPMPDPPTSEGPAWPWWRKTGLVGFIVCIAACAVSIPQLRDDTLQVWDYIMLSGSILGGFFGWLALGAPGEA